jgi:sugar phosphate isomerase/epimerase
LPFVHDNNKDRDAHLWPGSGSIDWKETMDLLRRAPQPPPLLLEVEGDPEGTAEFGRVVPEKMKAAFGKLEV